MLVPCHKWSPLFCFHILKDQSYEMKKGIPIVGFASWNFFEKVDFLRLKRLKLPDSSLVPILLITAFLLSSSSHFFPTVVWQGRNKVYAFLFPQRKGQKTWQDTIFPYWSKCLWISEQVIINAFERACLVTIKHTSYWCLEFCSNFRGA